MISVKDIISKITSLSRKSLRQMKLINSQKDEITTISSKFIAKNNNKKLDLKDLDTFHKAIWPVLTMAQIFAIMPVSNVKKSDPILLKFIWKSFKMLFATCFIILCIIITLLFTKNLLLSGINAKNVVGLIFFSCGILTLLMFLILAQHWPLLMQNWTKIELIFFMPAYKIPKIKLATRVRLAATVIISLATIEHAMFLLSSFHNFQKTVELCNVSYPSTYKEFFVRSYPHIFERVPYHIVIAFIVWFVNVGFTFVWNYMDLFIMMISLGISIRFEQLNFRISNLKGKVVHEDIWQEVRLHFIKLCELLEIADKCISPIILLSCTNNLYFICYQLLNIFNKMHWRLSYIYFWYSLLYLIGRTGCIFLCAAQINDESKKPLQCLRAVPSRNWCTDIERFIEMVTTQCVALSGMKFFFLTRKLLFGMAGTIVTYELVLLQFDEPNRVKGLPPLCG